MTTSVTIHMKDGKTIGVDDSATLGELVDWLMRADFNSTVAQFSDSGESRSVLIDLSRVEAIELEAQDVSES